MCCIHVVVFLDSIARHDLNRSAKYIVKDKFRRYYKTTCSRYDSIVYCPTVGLPVDYSGMCVKRNWGVKV